MRIALDFSTLDHLQMTAGHYRYVVQLVRGLAEIGSEQDFLLLGSRPKPVEELKDIFTPGSRWRYRQLKHWRHRGAIWVDELAYLRAFLAERISLLHIVHDFIPLSAGCPLIVTQHDLIEELFPEYEASRRDPLYRLHRPRLQDRAARVICISQTTADDLMRLWGIGPERSVVIHHGVEESFLMDPGDDLLKGHPAFEAGAVLLASPYNLEPRKNLTALLEALAILQPDFPQLKLVLFGCGLVTPERQRQFEMLVRGLGLQDAIVRLGIVSDAMLKQIYRRADIFAFPSIYEGFGLPVLEALATGACVLAGTTPATAEVAGTAAELVDTTKPRKLATAIAGLLCNPEHCAELRAAGPVRARQFPVDKMVRRTWETYRGVLELPGQPNDSL
jgi:glycosyltransferase involved in cell wall biosynthesis